MKDETTTLNLQLDDTWILDDIDMYIYARCDFELRNTRTRELKSLTS